MIPVFTPDHLQILWSWPTGTPKADDTCKFSVSLQSIFRISHDANSFPHLPFSAVLQDPEKKGEDGVFSTSMKSANCFLLN